MLVVEESRVILMWHLASSSGAAAINSDMFLKPVGHRHADGAGLPERESEMVSARVLEPA